MNPKLKERLLEVESLYHRADYLHLDPVEVVHEFARPEDQEVVALFAACLAYGKVEQIRRSLKDLMNRLRTLDASPAQLMRNLRSFHQEKPTALKALSRSLKGFKHRFQTEEDLFLLCRLVAWTLETHGSIGALVQNCHKPQDAHMGGALSRFLELWKLQAKRMAHPLASQTRSFLHLIPSPDNGSACKRWCLLFRWMLRFDSAIDLGTWLMPQEKLVIDPANSAPARDLHANSADHAHSLLNSAKLVMPLDTHTWRLSRSWGLTRQTSPSWKAALEVTQSLKHLDPIDPIRFDFALCRLGMLS